MRTSKKVVSVLSGAASYPLLDNLIAYWNLDEASGQRNDSHTNALHLIDNNTVGVASGGGPDGGDAADFVAASSEYLSRANESLLQTGDIDFTVAAWVYLPSDGNYYYINKGNDGAYQDEFCVRYTTSAKRFAAWVDDGLSSEGLVTANTFGQPSTGAWYFLMMWHDAAADTVSIAVNDVADSVSYSAGGHTNNHSFYIGTRGAVASRMVQGRMAYTGFWKRTLTAAERTWLYNSGSGRDYAAVAAYTG